MVRKTITPTTTGVLELERLTIFSIDLVKESDKILGQAYMQKSLMLKVLEKEEKELFYKLEG